MNVERLFWGLVVVLWAGAGVSVAVLVASALAVMP